MKRFNYISTIMLALTLTAMLGCASTAKKEGTGEYIDDSVITAKVKAAIFHDPSLKSPEINVETYKGVVQLSGFVTEKVDIKEAVEIAQSIEGVKSVKNDINVKP